MSDTLPPAPLPSPSPVPPLGLHPPGPGAVAGGASSGSPTSGLAIASLVLGIISLLCCTGILTAIPGIITGHMARAEIRRSGGALGGDGMALTGLILGYLTVAATIVGTALFLVFGLFTASIASQAPTAI